MKRLTASLALAMLAPAAAIAAADVLHTSSAKSAAEGPYAAAAGHKAFAQSPMGAWDWTSGQPDAATAGETALAQCRARLKAWEAPCLLVDVDGKAVDNVEAEDARVAEAHANTLIDAIVRGAVTRDKALGVMMRSLQRVARPPSLASNAALAPYHAGLRAFRAGNYDDAKEALARAAKNSPGIYQIHYALAVTLTTLRDYPAAETAMRHALWLEPAYPETWLGLAYLLHQRGADEASQGALQAGYLHARRSKDAASGNANFIDRDAVLERLKKSAEGEPDAAYQAVNRAAVAFITARASEQPDNAAARERRTEASQRTEELMRTCARPMYPGFALRNMQQGPVHASFLYGKDGKVVDTMLVQSSGYRQLDEYTLEALEKCRAPFPSDADPNERIWMSMKYVWRIEK